MAQIEVVRDPTIEQSEIVFPVMTPEAEGIDSPDDVPSETQQTKVFGVLVPILAINDIAVDWSDVLDFILDDSKRVPTCKFKVFDRGNIFGKYKHLGNDNELRVQILPPHENTYRKVNLTFLINSIEVSGQVVTGEATYKLIDFTSSRFKALGELSTYDLADRISTETGLGFASNIKGADDKRYIQCSYESYKDVLSREIEGSEASESIVLDWWVDLWNYINLCNLWDRVNSTDSDEDMGVWVSSTTNDTTGNSSSEPLLMPAVFTNNPAYENTEAHASGYEIINSPTPPSRGADVVMSVFEDDKNEWIEHLVGDGDIKKNKFVKYEYLGEVYGSYNYFVTEKLRSFYLAKLKSEVLAVRTGRPQLGLLRGSQCKFVWYDNDTRVKRDEGRLEEVGVLPSDEDLAEQLGDLAEWNIDSGKDDGLMINKQYSGRYTSIGQVIHFSGDTQEWDCWVYLVRPAANRPVLLQTEKPDGSN